MPRKGSAQDGERRAREAISGGGGGFPWCGLSREVHPNQTSGRPAVRVRMGSISGFLGVCWGTFKSLS